MFSIHDDNQAIGPWIGEINLLVKACVLVEELITHVVCA